MADSDFEKRRVELMAQVDALKAQIRAEGGDPEAILAAARASEPAGGLTSEQDFMLRTVFYFVMNRVRMDAGIPKSEGISFRDLFDDVKYGQ